MDANDDPAVMSDIEQNSNNKKINRTRKLEAIIPELRPYCSESI